MEKVTSADFQREFGRFRNQAQREPVMVTSYGRDDVVLVSAEEFKRLKQLELRPAFAWELPREVTTELGAHNIPEDAKQFDGELAGSR